MEDARGLYRNFDQYHPWLQKVLRLGLYSPGGGKQGMNLAWMDHQLKTSKEYRNQKVGSLAPETIEFLRTKWTEKAREQLGTLQNISAGQREEANKDLQEIHWAGLILDRWRDHEADEQWRQEHPDPPPPPETPEIVPQTTNLEPKLAPGPSEESEAEPPSRSEPEPEASLPVVAVNSNGEVSIPAAIQYLMQLEEKALAEDVTWQELKKGIAASAKIVDLIRENLGKAEGSRELVAYAMDVWLTYLDRVGTMLEEAKKEDLVAKVGRRRDQTKPTLESMGISDRLSAYIRQLRAVGLDAAKIELRKLDRLTKATLFKKLGQPKEKPPARRNKNEAENLNPMRHLVSFGADFKANVAWYNEFGGIHRFADDALVDTNLWPVLSDLELFIGTLAEALRAKHETSALK